MLVTITVRTLVRPTHFLHGAREVLDDDDHLRAGVGELVLELARRVQRIDVDHRAAGAQRAEQAHRILEDVGHHQRDARALRAVVRLQVRAERGRQRVELAEGDRLPHARVGRAIGEAADALGEHLADRRVIVDVDFGGHALRIVLEPDLVHESPPPEGCGARHGRVRHCRRRPPDARPGRPGGVAPSAAMLHQKAAGVAPAATRQAGWPA